MQAYPPLKPANSDARHYGDTENPGNGVYHICVWQATGHETEKKALEMIIKGAVLSAEARNAGYKANAVAMVMEGLPPVIQACGALFEVADEQTTIATNLCTMLWLIIQRFAGYKPQAGTASLAWRS